MKTEENLPLRTFSLLKGKKMIPSRFRILSMVLIIKIKQLTVKAKTSIVCISVRIKNIQSKKFEMPFIDLKIGISNQQLSDFTFTGVRPKV